MKRCSPAERAAENEGVIRGRCLAINIGDGPPSTGPVDDRKKPDGAQYAKHGFGGHAESGGAVGVGRGESYADDEREEREQRDLTTAEGQRADDGSDDERVVHEESGAGGGLVASLDRREVGVLPRSEELPLAKDSGCDHFRELASVVLGVFETETTPVKRLGRFVAGGVESFGAKLVLAVVEPEAEEFATVGFVAVGVHEQFVAVGRERHEIVE